MNPVQTHDLSVARRGHFHYTSSALGIGAYTLMNSCFQAFLLFDMDGDGCIDYSDLKATLISLGDKTDENVIRNMLAEVRFLSPAAFHSSGTYLLFIIQMSTYIRLLVLFCTNPQQLAFINVIIQDIAYENTNQFLTFSILQCAGLMTTFSFSQKVTYSLKHMLFKVISKFRPYPFCCYDDEWYQIHTHSNTNFFIYNFSVMAALIIHIQPYVTSSHTYLSCGIYISIHRQYHCQLANWLCVEDLQLKCFDQIILK